MRRLAFAYPVHRENDLFVVSHGLEWLETTKIIIFVSVRNESIL